jgi:hypothetical protein
LSNKASITYEAIWNIIEFYKIQPRVQELQIEKIEEYLILMNAHYQKSMTDIDECIGLDEPVCLEDVMETLNSYLNLIGEELIKIFPEDENAILPLNMHSDAKISEIQAIELYRNFNERERDLFQIKEAIDDLETSVFEENFAAKLAALTKDLISKINSDVIIRVDDLI